MKINTLKDLRKRTAQILSYMDSYYEDDIVFGRITLTRQLLSKIYKKNISLKAKIDITQKLINETAYSEKDKFQL